MHPEHISVYGDGRTPTKRTGEVTPSLETTEQSLAPPLARLHDAQPRTVMALQRKIGNAAVSQLLIQRSITQVQINAGHITSVAFDTNIRVGTHPAGQHTTSYAAFCQMVRNRLMGLTEDAALDELANMATQISYMPAYQATQLNPQPNTAVANIINAANALKGTHPSGAQVMGLANMVVGLRNSLHESSFNTPYPTHSGVNEANEAGILQHVDDQLRNGQAINYNAVNDVHAHVWNLFHWDPPAVTSNSEAGGNAHSTRILDDASVPTHT